MLKKLIVALLACLTLFLSQRALTESRAHAMPEHRSTVIESPSATNSAAAAPTAAVTSAPATVSRATVLF